MTEKYEHKANPDNVDFLSKKIFELFKIIENDFDVDVSVADVLCSLTYVLTLIYKQEGVSLENVVSNILGISQKFDEVENSKEAENCNEQKKQQHFSDVNEKIEEMPIDSALDVRCFDEEMD